MKIVRTYVPNSTANYNHLVYCPITRFAAAVDPFDADHLIQIAEKHKLDIKQIWITHEHGDHTRHLEKLKQMTNASVYAPETCKSRLQADEWLSDLQEVRLGDHKVIHHLTPGHTPGHGIFSYQNSLDPDQDFAVCGDTLFNAGVGNVYSGNVDELFETINTLTARLTPSTKIFIGHDYIETNLKFTLHHCPTLEPARQLLEKCTLETPDTRTITTLAQEKQHNLFFRLASSEVCNLLPHCHSDKDRFKALRTLRDSW